jgi:hypothetical protein
VDPVRDPYAPGAGTPPAELAGRNEARETVSVDIERLRRGLPSKSVLRVGLRGVGKTVLLDRMRDDAESSGVHSVRIEGPEGRSLPSLLAPQLRQALLRLSRTLRAHDYAVRGLRALAGFVKGLKAKYGDIEVGIDHETTSPSRAQAHIGPGASPTPWAARSQHSAPRATNSSTKA